LEYDRINNSAERYVMNGAINEKYETRRNSWMIRIIKRDETVSK
jgi:hypothetical protein